MKIGLGLKCKKEDSMTLRVKTLGPILCTLGIISNMNI